MNKILILLDKEYRKKALLLFETPETLDSINNSSTHARFCEYHDI